MALRIPSRGSDQFNLRFPDGMRDRLREAAEANGRSMNAEIIARLEKSLGAEDDIRRNIFIGGRPLELGEEFLSGFIDLLDKARAKHDAKYGVVPEDQRTRATLPLHVKDNIDLLHDVDTAALDAWIATRPDPKPSREEAARALIAEGLQAKGVGTTPPTKGHLARELGGDPFDVALPTNEKPRALDLEDEPSAEDQPTQPDKSRRLLSGLTDDTPSTPTPKRPSRAR